MNQAKRLNVWNDWNHLPIAVQRLMLNSNPRVGEIKLEEITDRSIVRKLDDSGFIERLYSVYPAK